MAYTVPFAFDQYFDNINLSGDHREVANARRDSIVSSLKDRLTIVEAFSTGSIPRFTALSGSADLDVIVALHYGKHAKDKTPTQVLQLVRDALAEFRTNVRKNGQAVTLYYKTWPNVDIVPAVRFADSAGNITHYEIPDANSDKWLLSKPKTHSSSIDFRAGQSGPSFRKLIKMMKHWSRHHGDYLQSYHIEVMALRSLTGALVDSPWDAYQFFKNALALAAQPLWHDGSFVDDYLSTQDRLDVLARLTQASEKASAAWYMTFGTNDDHKGAIGLWRQILGNDFPAYG